MAKTVFDNARFGEIAWLYVESEEGILDLSFSIYTGSEWVAGPKLLGKWAEVFDKNKAREEGLSSRLIEDISATVRAEKRGVHGGCCICYCGSLRHFVLHTCPTGVSLETVISKSGAYPFIQEYCYLA